MPGPVRIRAASYDVMRRLADGVAVTRMEPASRLWLKRQGYIEWTREIAPGKRDYALTDLGRSVIASAIRVAV